MLKAYWIALFSGNVKYTNLVLDIISLSPGKFFQPLLLGILHFMLILRLYLFS